MKGAKFLLGISLSLGTLGAAVGGAVFASSTENKVESAEAATATTVYYAISSSDVGSYTVKCNVNRRGDGSNWATYEMSRDGTKTYNGKYIYKVTFTDLYDGLGALQFQLYEGETWISQVQPISGWTVASTYNNKLWSHNGSSWRDYAYDSTPSTRIYYAISSSDVGSYTVKCNVNKCGDTSDHGEWATYTMSRDGTKTYNSKLIYTTTIDALHGGLNTLQFQLYNGDTYQSQVQVFNESWNSNSVYSNKLYEKGDSSWKTYGYDVTKTIYLNCSDWGSLYIHCWNTGVAATDTTWPGRTISFTDPNLRFNGDSKLQAVSLTVLSTATPRFLYQSAPDTNKSDDFTITDGAYYWKDGGTWKQETGNLASAAAYVWDFNTARLAVPASGNIKAYSICGLDLESWYERYSSLTSSAKTIVNGASIYTYKDASSSGADTRVSFSEIISYMESEYGVNTRIALIVNSDSKSYFIIFGVVVLILGAAGYFYFRKRKVTE